MIPRIMPPRHIAPNPAPQQRQLNQYLPEPDMPMSAEMMATASARLAAAAGHLDLAVQAAQQLHLQSRAQGQEGPRLRTFVPALMLAAHQGAPDAAAQVCI